METKNVKHRLTLEEYTSVYDKYEQGMSVSKLSEKFKISRPTVYTILEKVRKDQKKNEFFIKNEEENKDNEIMTSNNTNFLGIVIDTENGSNNPKINKALNASFDLLDIMKFVEVTKFKLNTTMFDYFWQVVVGNRRVHLSPMVLTWFGYEGEIKEQKKAFIKMLQRNEIEYYQLTQKDQEIELYSTIKTEIAKMPSCDAVKSKFLIMAPNDIKMAIMQLKTKNGHTIRQYYIDIEELLKLYTEYTLYFNHRESQRKITNLEKMMTDMKLERQKDRELIQQQTQYMKSLGISLEEVKDQNEELLDETRGLKKQNKKIQHKLGIAVEDRAPQPEDESKRERFVLIKRNDPEYYLYYTIRAQEGYTTRKLKFEKANFPNLEVLLDFKCNPNSKTLYNRIKENLKVKNVTFKGNNIDLEGSEVDENKLVEEMKVINDSKRDI
ncbi:hypothetical protein WIV_gp026 [Wiseana iridescent virus]|uniref:Uncharacterized protein n=1 Tax=Wiseana iridescent virus TaxID=68347 RepID=G0T552_IRV9|nr:hypothetical protein WIV_gp026 [Wiseana iridescent virus]ADO00369.1 hypothetical protein [Wiseana iridescent virus]